MTVCVPDSICYEKWNNQIVYFLMKWHKSSQYLE